MCLAIPGIIESITGEDPLERIAKVNFGGIRKEVYMAYVPEARIGDYVIVHAGFAISLLNQEEAMQTLEDFRQIAELYAGEADGEVH